MTRSQLNATTQQSNAGTLPPYFAGKNFVINGGMDIWQRGTSIAGAASYPNYTADRWQGNRYGGASGATFSRQSSGYTGIQYCMRAQRDSGNTGTALVQLSQSFETANSIPFAGKSVTVSFYARAGANYSSSGNSLSFKLSGGTATDQNWLTNGFTGQSDIIFQGSTLTTSWQRFTYTATVDSSITQLALYYYYTPVGTAGANDYFEITGIQLEQGSVATTFSRAGGDIQGELAKCQRYYYRNTAGGAYGTVANSLNCTSTTVIEGTVRLPVTMRIAPYSLDTSNLLFQDGVNSITANGTFAIQAGSGANSNLPYFYYTHGSAAFTQFRYYYLSGNNNAAGYIGFSAEL